MFSSYVGDRHSGPVRLLDQPDFLCDGPPSPAFDAGDNFDTLGVRHSRIHRRMPMSSGYAACPVETGASPKTHMSQLKPRGSDEQTLIRNQQVSSSNLLVGSSSNPAPVGFFSSRRLGWPARNYAETGPNGSSETSMKISSPKNGNGRSVSSEYPPRPAVISARRSWKVLVCAARL